MAIFMRKKWCKKMFNLYGMPNPFKDIYGLFFSVSFLNSYFFQKQAGKTKQNNTNNKQGDLLSKRKEKQNKQKVINVV